MVSVIVRLSSVRFSMPLPGRVFWAGGTGLSLQTRHFKPSGLLPRIGSTEDRLRAISRLTGSASRNLRRSIGTSSLAGAHRTMAEPVKKPP